MQRIGAQPKTLMNFQWCNHFSDINMHFCALEDVKRAFSLQIVAESCSDSERCFCSFLSSVLFPLMVSPLLCESMSGGMLAICTAHLLYNCIPLSIFLTLWYDIANLYTDKHTNTDFLFALVTAEALKKMIQLKKCKNEKPPTTEQPAHAHTPLLAVLNTHCWDCSILLIGQGAQEFKCTSNTLRLAQLLCFISLHSL